MKGKTTSGFPSWRLKDSAVSDISNSYLLLLNRCCENRNLKLVKELHANLIRAVKSPERFLLNNFINAYCKLQNIGYARKVFDGISKPNAFSWNSILATYSVNGCVEEMQEIFNLVPKKNEVSWNLVITGYARRGLSEKAVEAYRLMLIHGLQNLNRITIVAVLGMLSTRGWLYLGKAIHGQIVKFGFESYLFVGSSLVDMYSKFGLVFDAKSVFDQLPERNVVAYNTMLMAFSRCGMIEWCYTFFNSMPEKDLISWTTMVTALTNNGMYKDALTVFCQMSLKGLDLDRFAFGTSLTACGALSLWRAGKQIHSYIVRTDQMDNVFVSSALIDMYSKCRDIRNAERVFRTTVHKNVVSWTAMIVGYRQNSFSEEAVRTFCEMQENGIGVDDFTLGSVISSCGDLASLEEGAQFHCQATASGLISFTTVSNALVSLYGKCGNTEEAHKLFHEIKLKDEVSWTALVSGYAQFGKVKETMSLFEEMLARGLQPDGVTFIGVLSACSRAGFVQKGREYFAMMVDKFQIKPALEHYTCMIDLFSRAGQLEAAKNFIQQMPCHPDTIGWTTLLSSCRNRGNMEIGKWAADFLLELDPQNSAAHMLLASIYAAKGKWNKVAELKRGMRNMGVRKEPGCSWIKYKGKVHIFTADDTSSPLSDQIYQELENLSFKMREEGYVPDVKSVLHDVSDSEKLNMLSHHSERLAIAFGLLFIPSHLPIKVVKNLRVCDDCHNASKIISRITQREILVRDSMRYHLFKDGKCSCGDFW